MGETVKIVCGSCGKRLKAKKEMAGKDGKCPCGEIVEIPVQASTIETNLDVRKDTHKHMLKALRWMAAVAAYGIFVSLLFLWLDILALVGSWRLGEFAEEITEDMSFLMGGWLSFWAFGWPVVLMLVNELTPVTEREFHSPFDGQGCLLALVYLPVAFLVGAVSGLIATIIVPDNGDGLLFVYPILVTLFSMGVAGVVAYVCSWRGSSV